MTLLQLLKEIRDMGPVGERLRKVKCGDIEIELAAPVDTEAKTIEIKLPEKHGSGMTDAQMQQREDDEAREILYGAGAARAIPSDYGPT